MFAHLTVPQYIYLAVVGCYLLFLYLFFRLFWWKLHADRHFWRNRPDLSVAGLVQKARELGQPLPRFSIFVPARNEADVIERTVDHLCRVAYPPELCEVLIVTDQKETLAADARRKSAVAVAAAALRDDSVHLSPMGADTEAGGLLLALIGRLALERFDEVRYRFGDSEGIHLLRRVPDVLLRALVWESADSLLQHGGRRVSTTLLRRLRVRLPQIDETELASAYSALLALTIPSVVAFASLRGNDGRSIGRRLAALAAQAHHQLTREILQSMCDSVASDLIADLEAMVQGADFEARLAETYREIYPTTQDIMERKLVEVAGRTDRPELKHVIVPRDFDGELGGRCLGVDVPSTKGRALNCALGFMDGRTTWCGFYDAESRPDLDSLLYVAHRTIEAKAGNQPEPRIFQGPIFQVRNWYEMGPFCKVASLYQSIAHDWYLPTLFRRIPFVGGTNVYVNAPLLRTIGGYDYSTLTEDLELGTRAYLLEGAWPEYLPCPTSEQTPPTFTGFYRQRLRWATGHLQVMNKIRTTPGYDEVKRRKLLKALWWKGQFEWVFFQAMTLLPPLVTVLYLLDLVDPSVLPLAWHLLLNVMGVASFGFTIYAFFRYVGHLDRSARPTRWPGQLGAFAQLLVVPLAAFLFPVPYSSALVLASLGRGPSAWVKTPRTRE
jgi:cellulose synthase/poly-beta-1,6-N-acetylglucosamine synthase-like glycosyltransferase